MRRLVVTENVSFDGVMAPMDGWFDPSRSDEDLLAASRAHREAADALVLGRVTYQEFAGFWPYQHDDQTGVSSYLDQVAKYVVSGSLDRAEWQNSTVLRGPVAEELAALKAAPGRDIVVTGSCQLVRSLAPLGLIDVYRLFVYPVVQGHGHRPFPDGFSTALELIESRPFPVRCGADGVQDREVRFVAWEDGRS